jgi:hypothetical protein
VGPLGAFVGLASFALDAEAKHEASEAELRARRDDEVELRKLEVASFP